MSSYAQNNRQIKTQMPMTYFWIFSSMSLLRHSSKAGALWSFYAQNNWQIKTNMSEIFLDFSVLRVGSDILQKVGASEDDMWK